MKKNNPKTFIFGMAFGISLFAILSFSSSDLFNDNRNPENTPSVSVFVDQSTAAQYRSNYKANFSSSQEAVNISTEQLDAIDLTIKQQNIDLRKVSGFRLYFGAVNNSPNSEKISLVYTLNNELNENIPGSNISMAQGFDDKYSQQCPPFCD